MTFAVDRTEHGWSIRVPLRREEIRIEKRTVIGERVLIRRRPVADVERVKAQLKREELSVEGHAMDTTQPLDTTTRMPHDTLAGSGMEQETTR